MSRPNHDSFRLFRFGRRFLSICALVAFSTLLNAQTGQIGTVSGYIFNAGIEKYISNMEVNDQETVKIVVTYAGLDTLTIDVEVVAGQKVMISKTIC